MLIDVLIAVVGLASGFVIGTRQTPRMIARMTPEEVDALGARVERLKHDAR